MFKRKCIILNKAMVCCLLMMQWHMQQQCGYQNVDFLSNSRYWSFLTKNFIQMKHVSHQTSGSYFCLVVKTFCLMSTDVINGREDNNSHCPTLLHNITKLCLFVIVFNPQQQIITDHAFNHIIPIWILESCSICWHRHILHSVLSLKHVLSLISERILLYKQGRSQ